MSIRITVSLLLVGVVAGSAGRSQAGERFTAVIDGDQAGTGSLASGTATLTLSADESQLEYEITIVGLDLDGAQTGDPNDDVTGLHIHNAPAGQSGAVIFGMISPNHDTDDLVIDPVAGTLTGVWEDSDPANANLSDMLEALRNEELYINVHTVAFGGGEIRGQIIPQGLVHVVTAAGFAFDHVDITINEDDTVRWELVRGFHTVTEGTDGTIDGDELFHSDLDLGTPVFEFTFSDMSDVVIDYFCAIHFDFGMSGTITILPSETPCEGDANGDGTVDPLDSGFVLARFGCPVGAGDASCDAADQNGDGAVDPLDSGFVLARFGPCP